MILKQTSTYLQLINCLGSWSNALHQMVISSTAVPWMYTSPIVVKYTCILAIHYSFMLTCFFYNLLIVFFAENYNLGPSCRWKWGLFAFFASFTTQKITQWLLNWQWQFVTINYMWIMADAIRIIYSIVQSNKRQGNANKNTKITLNIYVDLTFR